MRKHLGWLVAVIATAVEARPAANGRAAQHRRRRSIRPHGSRFMQWYVDNRGEALGLRYVVRASRWLWRDALIGCPALPDVFRPVLLRMSGLDVRTSRVPPGTHIGTDKLVIGRGTSMLSSCSLVCTSVIVAGSGHERWSCPGSP